MFKITNAQIHTMVLGQRKVLVRDIEEHLSEFRPDILLSHPRPRLFNLINSSIDLAERFGIDDVYSMRLFVRLRWDIAPGFYKQPQIAQVLSRKQHTAEHRFRELATEGFAQAWEDAQKFNEPCEWTD